MAGFQARDGRPVPPPIRRLEIPRATIRLPEGRTDYVEISVARLDLDRARPPRRGRGRGRS